ncbi:unnamed protein product, partial [Didymodactylos carnosus]
IYHYQFKVITKSWFEAEPDPALPVYHRDETKKENEKMEKEELENYERLLNEVRERNKQREGEATYTELWYTFVDPYAVDVDERGSDDAHKAVGVLTFKNGQRIIDEYQWKYDGVAPLVENEKLIIYEIHIGDFQSQFKDVIAKMDYFLQLGITAGKKT